MNDHNNQAVVMSLNFENWLL